MVREVRSVRDRQSQRERETVGRAVTTVVLKLAMSSHFPLPKNPHSSFRLSQMVRQVRKFTHYVAKKITQFFCNRWAFCLYFVNTVGCSAFVLNFTLHKIHYNATSSYAVI